LLADSAKGGDEMPTAMPSKVELDPARKALLVLIRALSNGHAVKKEAVVSRIDAALAADDPLGLRATLGPRPRLAQLYRLLGDLVDSRLVAQSTSGFLLTDQGNELADDASKEFPELADVVSHSEG
jgi:hypothetical protein